MKVLVLPFSDLCKRLQMSLGDEFFGEKAMPSRVLSVKILELWGFMFREIVFFTSLPSRRPC